LQGQGERGKIGQLYIQNGWKMLKRQAICTGTWFFAGFSLLVSNFFVTLPRANKEIARMSNY
jgi:hypothetical protein